MNFTHKPTTVALRLAGLLLAAALVEAIGAEAKSRFTGRIPKLFGETR